MDDGKIPVLFLAGIGRSGTTLMERILDAVPGVTGLGEVMHLWERGLSRNELCGCGVPFLACPFWAQVGEDAFGGWSNVDAQRVTALKGRVDRAIRVPSVASGRPRRFIRDVEEYTDYFVRIYRAAHRRHGGVLIDSSKQVSLAWCLSRVGALDLRVVHCIRDSRGVAYSWSREVVRPEAVAEEYRTMPRYSAQAISLFWLLHNIEIEALGARVPVLRMRYEDFVREPGPATSRLLEFARADGCADHGGGPSVRLGPTHSCAGNPMRFRTGRIDVAPDTRWMGALTATQRRMVTAATVPLLMRYGYQA